MPLHLAECGAHLHGGGRGACRCACPGGCSFLPGAPGQPCHPPAAVIELALNQQRTGAVATLSADQAAWARGVAARI